MENQITIEELERISSQVRRDIVRMVNAVSSGHPGGSLGCADFMTALFFKALKHYPSHFEMDGINEDLFFLSNGHISPVYYSVLARSGYFPVAELSTFRKLNSRLQGHPATHEHIPGVRIATGSLGQGLSVAIGASLSKKMNADNNLIYTLQGDGELQEGQNWEAFMFAAHQKVDNIISTIDYNHKQIDGPIEKIMSLGNLHQKLTAFGWDVIEVEGNQMNKVVEGLEIAKSMTGKGKPVAIILHTKMGYGVDFMEDSHKWHGVAPNNDQLTVALSQLQESLGDY
jgi:transketolase